MISPKLHEFLNMMHEEVGGGVNLINPSVIGKGFPDGSYLLLRYFEDQGSNRLWD
jgi:hypothetical protein